ncbi:MAG: hypothetical protein ACT4QD_22025 [Acidobacteriota bacterium]
MLARAPLYLLAQWLFPPTDFWPMVSPRALAAWHVAALTILAGLLVLFLPLLRREATARFWGVGMVLSIVPSCAVFPMDRMLLYSGIGGAALLAQLAGDVFAGRLVAPSPRLPRLVYRVAFDVLIAMNFVVAPLWLAGRVVVTADAMDRMTDGIETLASNADLAGKLVGCPGRRHVDPDLLRGVASTVWESARRSIPGAGAGGVPMEANPARAKVRRYPRDGDRRRLPVEPGAR